MTTWRWRRCPGCQEVQPAGDYEWLGGAGWNEGENQRQCPLCGFVGRTFDFQDVRERHPGDPSAGYVAVEPKRRKAERWDCACNGHFPSWGGYPDDAGTDGTMSLAGFRAYHIGPRCAVTRWQRA